MNDSLEELYEEVQRISCALNALREEAKQLPDLADVIVALATFGKALDPGAKYRKEGERYVLRPNTFVTFTVRYKRSHHLTITLRGNLSEFETAQELPLKNGRAGAYSECNLSSPKQLAAAAAYIQRAYQLCKRGAGRVHKKPVKTEVPVNAK